MDKREKVLNGLERCIKQESCEGCPYFGLCGEEYDAMIPLLADANSLMKSQLARIAELETAQQPRVMTADEMIEAVKTNEAVYVEESPEGSSQHCFWGLVVEGCDPPQDGGYNYPGGVLFNVINAYEDMWDGDLYGLNSPLGWRCWTAKPTEEQRKAVKWDE